MEIFKKRYFKRVKKVVPEAEEPQRPISPSPKPSDSLRSVHPVTRSVIPHSKWEESRAGSMIEHQKLLNKLYEEKQMGKSLPSYTYEWKQTEFWEDDEESVVPKVKPPADLKKCANCRKKREFEPGDYMCKECRAKC